MTWKAETMQPLLKKRYAADRRFRRFGLAAVGASLLFLALLFLGIIGKGYTAFQQTRILLEIQVDPEQVDPEGTGSPEALATADFGGLIKRSLRRHFPAVSGRRDKRKLYRLVSPGAEYLLRDRILTDPGLVGKTVSLWVPAAGDVDMLMKGRLRRALPEADRALDDRQLEWIDTLIREGRLKMRFNATFFTAGDSRDPESAGILGALVGSILTLSVTLFLAFPVGVSAAVYLEQFAPKNRWTDLIEININNLAAVPSIVFGLLGLAVFINFFGLPRSAPLVGGLVLALVTLPTVIIAGRAALKSVSPAIREAALALGASQMQAVMHHVLPAAMPGILTGTIIGMARALGETAPLLMIGMVAFIADIPKGLFDPSAVLPVQIFLWADSPERGFMERTAAAIMVLLLFLIAMNATAVVLRKRFERNR